MTRQTATLLSVIALLLVAIGVVAVGRMAHSVSGATFARGIEQGIL